LSSISKVPPVNVLEPQVAVTLLVASVTAALNASEAVALTYQTAYHPPAKAVSAVIEKKTDCPSIFTESGVEVAEHSEISFISNKAVLTVFESCAKTLNFSALEIYPLNVAESPENVLSLVTGKLNLVNLKTKSAAESPFP